jgi:DnaJ-class molecular chaperone
VEPDEALREYGAWLQARMEREPAGSAGERKVMSHAEKCPVCQGFGHVLDLAVPTATSRVPMRPCHGCGGTGWVTVQDGVGLPLDSPRCFGPKKDFRTAEERGTL